MSKINNNKKEIVENIKTLKVCKGIFLYSLNSGELDRENELVLQSLIKSSDRILKKQESDLLLLERMRF